MYLLLILSCIFTIAVILLLNIKKPLQQVFVFLVTLIVFMGFSFLFGDMAKTYNLPSAMGEARKNVEITLSQMEAEEAHVQMEAEEVQVQSQEEEEEESIPLQVTEQEIVDKINRDDLEKVNYLLNPLNSDEYDPAYSPDKLIPNCSYNIGDCTNDMSCIIPPNNANLYGPITPRKNTLSPKKNRHPERKCNILPEITIDRTKHCSNCGGILNSAKKVKNNCTDVEKVVNNYDRLCLHCKVGVRMNSRCFNGKDLPIEYYPI
jgi:hypothetical protein